MDTEMDYVLDEDDDLLGYLGDECSNFVGFDLPNELSDFFGFDVPNVGIPVASINLVEILSDPVVLQLGRAEHVSLNITGDVRYQETVSIWGFDPAEDAISVTVNGAPAQGLELIDGCLLVNGAMIAAFDSTALRLEEVLA